jgi:TM2 domain-containing membrane protein YozV
LSSNPIKGKARYHRGIISPYTINILYQKNPWVTVWWSIAFPGLGYILLGKPLKGIIFLVWEILINMKASINTAILYSFTGNFELAKQVVDSRWLLIYASVLIFLMWDTYHLTQELNKISILAERETPSIQFMAISPFGLNFLSRVNPCLAAIWSAFIPGLGHIYLRRLIRGSVIMILWISFAVLSGLYQAIQLTATGSFSEAAFVLNPQWFLNLPSIFVFSIYSSYVVAVEINKLVQAEKNYYLQENFQDPAFDMPV